MKTNTLATLLLGFAAGAAAVLFCQTEEGAKAKEKVKEAAKEGVDFVKAKMDELKKEAEDEQ
jgi:gas vesicle protein